MLRKRIIAVALGMSMCLMALAGCANTSEEPTATATATGNGTTETTAITIDGSTSVYPLMTSLVEKYTAENKNVDIQVEQGGSGVGIKDAQEGNVNIGMSSRELKDTETGLSENKICLDGIAIVTNTGNKVTNLTADQLKKIYTFEITNWKEVGGDDHKISVVTREATSGTRGAFEELVLGDDQVIDETKCAAVANSTGNAAQTVQSDKYAIAYISLGALESYDVTALKIGDVAATAENVINGTYTIARPFLLVTKGDATGEVKNFIEWIMTSDEAEQIIKDEKFIPAK